MQQENELKKKLSKEYVSTNLKLVKEALTEGDIHKAHNISVSLFESTLFQDFLLIAEQADIFHRLGIIYENHQIYDQCSGNGSAQTYYLRALSLAKDNQLHNQYKESAKSLESIEEKLFDNLAPKSFFSFFPRSLKTIQYFKKYQQIRNEYIEGFKDGVPTNILSKGYASSLKKLLKNVLSSIASELGDPPCHFDIITFGSIAGAHMGPYSDVDCGIIIENDEKKGDEYFEKLIRLYGFYLRGMCGTWITNEKIIQYVGLHLDDGDVQQATSVEGVLQQNPMSLVNWVLAPLDGDYDMNWAYQYALLRSTCVFSSQKNQELWEDYQNVLFTELSLSDLTEDHSSDIPKKYQSLGIEFLKRHNQDYINDMSQFDNQTSVVNLKKDFLSPLMFYFMDMGLYLGLKQPNDESLLSNAEEILTVCTEMDILSETQSDFIKNALEFLQFLRVKYQIERKGQPDLVRMPEGWCDTVSMDASIPMLTQEEAKRLNEVKDILRDIYIDKSFSFMLEKKAQGKNEICCTPSLFCC